MSEMIERVARALWLDRATCADKEALWGRLADFDREPYFSAARAAIAAMREPAEAVIEAGFENDELFIAWTAAITPADRVNIWQAMIDAALATHD